MTQILSVTLALAHVAGMPVTLLLAGSPVSVSLLILVTDVPAAGKATWSVRAIPRQSWPVLHRRRGIA